MPRYDGGPVFNSTSPTRAGVSVRTALAAVALHAIILADKPPHHGEATSEQRRRRYVREDRVSEAVQYADALIKELDNA